MAGRVVFSASAELFGFVRLVADSRRGRERASDAEIGRVIDLESARTSRWKHGQIEVADAARLMALSQEFDIDLTVLCHVAAGLLSASSAWELISGDRRLVRFLGENLVLASERRRISVVSGEGSEARITRQPDGSYERTFLKRGVAGAAAGGGRPAVLLVDDDPRTLELFGNLLGGKTGVEGIVARSGAEALLTAGERRPRLVLFDLFIGGVDGLAAVRSLAAGRGPSAPLVIATTLHPTPEVERAARGNGAADLLQRPLRPRVLSKLLRSVRGA